MAKNNYIWFILIIIAVIFIAPNFKKTAFGERSPTDCVIMTRASNWYIDQIWIPGQYNSSTCLIKANSVIIDRTNYPQLVCGASVTLPTGGGGQVDIQEIWGSATPSDGLLHGIYFHNCGAQQCQLGSTCCDGWNYLPAGSLCVQGTCNSGGQCVTNFCTLPGDTAPDCDGIKSSELITLASSWVASHGTDDTLRSLLGIAAQDWVAHGGPI